MNKLYHLLMLICLGALAVTGHTQSISDNFPKLRTRSARVLRIEDALPTACFEQVFLDHQGRMWLTPCGESQRIRGLHLIQFDGQEGNVHDLGLETGASVLFGGVLRDSLLCGINLSQNYVFSYSIPTQTVTRYTPDEKGYLYYQIQIIDDRPFVLATNGDRHDILELKDQKLVVRNEIPWPYGNRNRDYLLGLYLQVVTVDHKIYFTDGQYMVYGFDTNSFTSDSFPIPTSGELDNRHLINWAGQLILATTFHQSSNILQLGPSGFAATSLLPAGWTYSTDYPKAHLVSFAYADESGWLFLNTRDATGHIRQLLQNKNGTILDYTSVYQDLGKNDYGLLSGHDFTREVQTLSGEVDMLSVSSDNGMQTITTHPARALIPWSRETMLLLTDVSPEMIGLHDTIRPAVKVPSAIHPSERKAILRDADDDLWFVDSDTIKQYHVSSHHLDHWYHPAQVDHIVLYQQKVIFLGEGRMYEIDPDAPAIREIQLTGHPSQVDGNPNAMFVQGSWIWIATSKGLWRADMDSLLLRKIPLPGFSNVSLLTMYYDSQGSFWFGTESHGIIQFNPNTGAISNSNYQSGLSHNTVVSILEDDAGLIWASTFYGLNVLNRQMEVVASFFEQDGLIYNEGNRWSQYKLPDGRLIFGTVRGITIIDPVKALASFQNHTPPLMYCKSVSYFTRGKNNRKVILNPDLVHEVIALPADRRTLRLQLGTSEYIESASTEYSYKLEMPGYEWAPAGNQASLIINNLPSGDYSILIRARNMNRAWSVNTLRISLSVAQPFYRAWWFYVLCAMPFAGFLALWFWNSRRERVRLELEVSQRTARIAQQTEELKMLDQAKTRIYTNITHEFRTPLTVIKGTTDLLQGNDEQKSILRRNTNRLLNLVNQLLELSKLESGNLETHMTLLNVVLLTRDIVESFLPIASRKDISLHFYASKEDIHMDADMEILHRIIGNLLSNALKFTPAGGNIYVEMELTGYPDSPEERLRLLIRDTGIGIPADKIDKIFNRFYQADDSSTRAGEGTGIGLALTRELVLFLQGNIDVHSVPGQGSTFTVLLPVTRHALPADENADDRVLSNAETESHTDPVMVVQAEDNTDLPLVLIVEDNPDVIHYLVSCLQGKYRLLMAMDGQQGFEKAMQAIPDLILSDVMMPIRDGIQLCEDVKSDEHTSHIPVVLLTAKVDIASRIEGLARGADAYLAKPFEKQELLLVIRNLIESRKSWRLRYLADGAVPAEQDSDVQHEDAFMTRLNTLIDQHMEDEDFGVLQLGHQLKYSRSQLHNKVKTLTGYPTSLYIQFRRLQFARTLLLDGDKTISEVAFTTGFRDPNYFSRVFKKEFGITPSEFIQSRSGS